MAILPPSSPGADPSQSRGGGIFLAIGPIAGAVIGGRFGQPTIGLLAGVAVGLVICLALWIVDRRRG